MRELVLVCVGVAVKRTMYQRKVDVDMLNAVKSVLAEKFACYFAMIRMCPFIIQTRNSFQAENPLKKHKIKVKIILAYF